MTTPPPALAARAPSAVRTRLRAAIHGHHEAIEALPLPRSIMAGELPKDLYIDLLSQLLAVHEALDAALEDSPELRQAAEAFLRREAIAADIAALDAERQPARATTKQLCDSIAAAGRAGLPERLGALYVVAGSRLGGMVQAPHLSRALGVPMAPGAGLDLHLGGAEALPGAWRALCERFERELEDESDADRATRSASQTMARIFAVYEELSGGLEP